MSIIHDYAGCVWLSYLQKPKAISICWNIIVNFFFFFVKKVWGLYFKICYKCEINICEMYASYNVYLKYA